MKLHRFLPWLSLGAVLATSTATAQDFEAQIQTISVDEGIYLLMGEGGNIGVSAGEDGVLLIDDEYAPLTEKVIAAVEEISPQPIRFVLNTHWHADHTGGNENLGEAGAVIVAHDQVRERLSTDQFVEALNQEFPASPPAALPMVTFNDSLTFHFNDEEIHAVHVAPAHTDGDSIVHFREANVVHLGDIYFNGSYPFIDISSGGSIEGMIAAIDQVLPLIDEQTQIIPGHGPLSNRAELLTYRDLLVTVRDRTSAAIADGLTVEEYIASQPTAEFDSTWGNGFLSPEQFLQIVYTDLSR